MAASHPVAAVYAVLALLAALSGGGSPPAEESAASRRATVALGADAFGRSGALTTRIAAPGEALALSLEWTGAEPVDAWYRWVPELGTNGGTERTTLLDDNLRAPLEPGVYSLEIGWADGLRTLDEMRVVVTVPLQVDARGMLQGYRIGHYPAAQQGRYAPPRGLIRVTPLNATLQLSRTFKLREFLTHDQTDVWPKFVVVDPLLLDKLELLRDELNASGVPVHRMIVMSGFRTPQYNRKGLDQGRAQLSRHQYGDAADVWVDNDGDWYMDDLNGDGRRDTGDARVMLAAVARVEARHPDLTGGAGVYADNGVHGPFLHVDVRGVRARW